MSKQKHILFLVPGFPKDEADDKCIPALQVYVRALADSAKYKVSIVAVNYPHQMDYYWHNIEVRTCSNTLKKPNKIQLFRRIYKSFKDINDLQKVDIIHAFWLNDIAGFGYVLSKLFRVKLLTTLMGQDATDANRYLKYLPIKKMNLVALSQFHKNEFYKTTKRKINKIIPWGVVENANHESVEHRSIDILGVGNLIKLKDYNLFLDIIKKVVTQYPEIKVEILGDGPERKNLEDKVVALNLESNVNLLGSLSRKAVFAKMIDSTLLLHTSKYESFGMIFIEALQCKAQVVSKPVGIAPELNQIHVADDCDGLTRKVTEVLASNDKVQNMDNRYFISSTIKQYDELYNNILKS